MPTPSQVPVLGMSVPPRSAVPLSVGSTVLDGGVAVTADVGGLSALAVPSGLVAVTTSCSTSPSSATATV